jgi:hypothetical protein
VQANTSNDVSPQRQPEVAVLLRGGSMRFLEVGLAIAAILTAVLLGQLR